MATVRDVLVPVLYSEVFGRSPVYHDLQEQLSSIPLEEMLRWLSGINCVIRNAPSATDPALQYQLLSSMPNRLWYRNRLFELLGSRYLFFLEQLAVLSKFAVLNCRGSSIPKDFMDRFLRSAMITSELRTAALATSGKGDAEEFVNLEIAGTFGFEDPLPNNLLIFHSFFKWSATDKAARSEHYLPIITDFEKYVRLTWKNYLAAGYACWGYFKQVDSPEAMTRVRFTFKLSDFVSKFAKPETLSRWLETAQIMFGEALEEFKKDIPPHFTGAWLYPFKTRPFLIMPNEEACCVHLPFLENSIAPGIFYRLADEYRKIDERLSGRLRAFFGNFYEDYVALLFERIAKVRGYPISREVEYGEGLKSSDCVFLDGPSAVFIEVVWSRFKQLKTLVELDPQSIDEDLERIIKKIRQLDRNIGDFKRGAYKLPGIDPTRVKCIYPIVVTSFALPHYVGIVSRIQTALDREHLLQGSEPLIISEVQAFDLYEPDVTSGISLVSLLDRKRDHALGRRKSLLNFLAMYGHEFGLSNVVSKPPALKAILSELQEICNSWGGIRFAT